MMLLRSTCEAGGTLDGERWSAPLEKMAMSGMEQTPAPDSARFPSGAAGPRPRTCSYRTSTQASYSVCVHTAGAKPRK